jgi:hypothetical protein
MENLEGADHIPLGKEPCGGRLVLPEFIHIAGIPRGNGKTLPVNRICAGTKVFFVIPVNPYFQGAAPLKGPDQVRQRGDMVKMAVGQYNIPGSEAEPLEPGNNCRGVRSRVNNDTIPKPGPSGLFRMRYRQDPAISRYGPYQNMVNHGGIIPCGYIIC